MASAAAGSGSPCGACKFLRRKCAADCIFAPYFSSEQGPARFAAIHKVFGASNVSKLLLHVPVAERCEAVVTIAYEAQARIKDPVYGCVAQIFALQQQVACLQTQVMQMKAQMAQGFFDSRNIETRWAGSAVYHPSFAAAAANFHINGNLVSPQSSLESVDGMGAAGVLEQEKQINNRRDDDDESSRACTFQQQVNYNNNNNNNVNVKKRAFPFPFPSDDLGELQELAVRMMRN